MRSRAISATGTGSFSLTQPGRSFLWGLREAGTQFTCTADLRGPKGASAFWTRGGDLLRVFEGSVGSRTLTEIRLDELELHVAILQRDGTGAELEVVGRARADAGAGPP